MESQAITTAHESPLITIRERVKGNWLTRRPAADAAWVVAAALLFTVLGSLVFWGNVFGAGEWMPASGGALFYGHEWWRAWTATLAHADLGHLLANSLLFFAFGYLLYGQFGVAVFPGVAFLFGGVTNLIVLATHAPDVSLIGVSGVVYWMGGAWITLYYALETREKKFSRALRAIGVALVLFVPETIQSHVSYRAHFVGFVLGVAWAAAYYRWHRTKFRAAEVRESIVEEDFRDL